MLSIKHTEIVAGSGSSNGCSSAWYSGGRGFDHPVRQIIFVETDHEMSAAILSQPLIQVGQ